MEMSVEITESASLIAPKVTSVASVSNVFTLGADEYKKLNIASHLICNCNLERYLKKVPVGKVRIRVIRKFADIKQW